MSTASQRLSEFENLLKTAPVPEDNAALTVRELAVALGRGENWVRASLRTAIDAGVWEVVRVTRKNIIGAQQAAPGYRPIVRKRKKR